MSLSLFLEESHTIVVFILRMREFLSAFVCAHVEITRENSQLALVSSSPSLLFVFLNEKHHANLSQSLFPDASDLQVTVNMAPTVRLRIEYTAATRYPGK